MPQRACPPCLACRSAHRRRFPPCLPHTESRGGGASSYSCCRGSHNPHRRLGLSSWFHHTPHTGRPSPSFYYAYVVGCQQRLLPLLAASGGKRLQWQVEATAATQEGRLWPRHQEQPQQQQGQQQLAAPAPRQEAAAAAAAAQEGRLRRPRHQEQPQHQQGRAPLLWRLLLLLRAGRGRDNT